MKLITVMTLMASEASEREKEEVTDDHGFSYAVSAHTKAFLLLCGSSEPRSSRVQRHDIVVRNRWDKRAAYIVSMRAGASSLSSISSFESVHRKWCMDRRIANHERYSLDPCEVCSGERHRKLMTLMTVMTLMLIDSSEERHCALSSGRRLQARTMQRERCGPALSRTARSIHHRGDVG